MEGSARSQQSTHSDFPAPLREDSMEWDSEYLELILKKLDSREKQMILQVMQRNFYELAGRIQNHLDSLDAIDVQLATAVDSPYALQGSEAEDKQWQAIRDEHHALHPEKSLAYESGWNRLDKWISDSTGLSTQAVAVLSLKPAEPLTTGAPSPDPAAVLYPSTNSSTANVNADTSDHTTMIPTNAPTMKPSSPSFASSELLMIRSGTNDSNNETVAINRSTDEITDVDGTLETQQFDGRLLLQLAVLAISVDAVDQYLQSLKTIPSSFDGFVGTSF